jgi:xanthine dehydrogenase YagS FAD-binding subunit
MNPFEYAAAPEVHTAVTMLSGTVRPLAGGTDLLPRLKIGLEAPVGLLDVKSGGLRRGIEQTSTGWHLGALTTLRDVQRHRGLAHSHTALVEAVAQAATPQIRNRATIAGNLLQRPRCWYYRHEHVDCWLSGGEDCPARAGRNEHHAVFDTGPCVAVHPSDAASSLVALGAIVHAHGVAGERSMPIAELFAPPTPPRRVEHHLADDELITGVSLPTVEGLRSTYVKAMDRAVWAFALVGVAAALRLGGDGTVQAVRLVASGVAAVPWRLRAAEDALRDRPLATATIEQASARAADGAQPLAHNRYKLQLLEGLTAQALEQLAPG